MIDLHLEKIHVEGNAIFEKMKYYRELFVNLDSELCKLGEDHRGHRELAITRTHLETALMYCQKCLAIQGEKRS